MKTIVLVDDHALFRRGVRTVIAQKFTVLAEGGTAGDAVELTTRLRPDVLVLDVSIPGAPAIETVRRVQRDSPATAIVILTMYSDRGLERQLLSAGASAFLTKTISESELANALATATPRSHNDDISSSGRREAKILTDRELEVLRLIALAHTNAEIASILHLAEGTVKRHTTNIYDRLGAVSRIDAVRKAERLGLLAPIP